MASAMESEMGPPSIEQPEGTEELIDVVAAIEMERQERAREVGNATACAAALRSLRTLHAREKEALQQSGPSADHSANLAALAAEISRVEKLGGNSNRAAPPDVQKREPRSGSRPGSPRGQARNNNRQTARRSGSR